MLTVLEAMQIIMGPRKQTYPVSIREEEQSGRVRLSDLMAGDRRQAETSAL